jgi:hypothetical protein
MRNGGRISLSKCPLVPGTEQLNHANVWKATVLRITVPYQVFLHPLGDAQSIGLLMGVGS